MHGEPLVGVLMTETLFFFLVGRCAYVFFCPLHLCGNDIDVLEMEVSAETWRSLRRIAIFV